MKRVLLSKIKNIPGTSLYKIVLLFGLLLLISGKGWAQPTADFFANLNAVCSGSNVTFTDNSSNITGSVLYSWDFGPGASPATATRSGRLATWSERRAPPAHACGNRA